MTPIEAYTFTPQPDGSVMVGGGSAPYAIRENGKGLTCTCPGFQYGHGCKHIARWIVQSLPDPLAPIAKAADRDALTHIRDLLAEPDDAVSWIVEGLLPAGGLSVFGGKPKGGKSTTARAIALRVARGEPVLGRTTTQGPVIYLGLEDPRRVTRNHFRALGAQPEDPLYVFTGSRPDEALVWLEGVLAKVDPVFCVADTLQHLLGVSDLNDYARVVAALGPLLALVRSRRAHLMLVHHAGKGDRTGFDAILGSVGIVGTVDVALLLRRREDNTRTLATMQRMGEDLPESVITLDAHHEPQLDGTRADYDARETGKRVLAWLETQTEPVTRKIVEESVEGRAEIVRTALYRLVETGAVARTGAGNRWEPYLFQLACPVSHPIPGHANTLGKTGDSSRDSATLACPGDSGLASPPDTLRDTQRCPRGHPMLHVVGADPMQGWVCLTCHPDNATLNRYVGMLDIDSEPDPDTAMRDALHRVCPKGHPMLHHGTDPAAGWVCRTCHPTVAAALFGVAP